MTPPPTSIDGTEITGATIDGQDVQEITIDGQTVFTAAPDLPASVTHRYPLDEGSGSTVFDSVGTNDLTNDGATYNAVNDAVGGFVLDFSLGDFNLEGPLVPEIGVNQEFTFAVTINPDNFSTRQSITNHNKAPGNRFGITIEPNGEVSTGLNNGSNFFAEASAPITLNTRQRVVYTHDGSGTGTVFVDKVSSSGGQTPAVSAQGFAIGSRTTNDVYFDGQLDEILIANEAFTQSQVDDDFDRQPYT